MSFVDKDQLEPGCIILLNHKVNYRSVYLLKHKFCLLGSCCN
jgi:hypothetical protein